MDLMTLPGLKLPHSRLSEASGLTGTLKGPEPVMNVKFGTVLRATAAHAEAGVNEPATVTVTVLALGSGRGNGQMIVVANTPMIELFK